ncbi:TPA: hypothetical protein N0F65_009990 [Lagenidium giganteum]|uniref:Eukaryotic translation initiation factor 3 subunit M n=1 Tax=Lagenidium giganteum TaxID=4803 RepID=A0AAV2ZHR9_9STRA|nr:TPA: hypothetical protein N0F65_009990 [Lagenidium giganteum]
MVAITTTASDLVAYVNTLLDLSEKKPLDFAAEIKKQEFAPVIAAVLPQAEQLFELDAETAVEGAFSMLFDLIAHLAADKVAAEAKNFLAAVLSKVDDKAVLRLRIATNAFNKSAAFPEVRFDILVQVIEYANKSDNLELLANYFEDIEALLDIQALSAEKRRKLFLIIADVLEKKDAKSVKVLLFFEKYLNTFAGVTDAKQLEAGKAVAVRATKFVLANPITSFIARVDIVASPAVAALKNDAKNAKLFQLLEIVSSKTLADYTAFEKAAGSFFKDNGLSEEQCASNMRLFTLCALPTGFDEIPFATIAKSLGVPEDDTEKWVVKAITANLLTAKVDQLRRTVVVTRALQRSFGPAQWKEMDVKLQLYKANVGKLLELVRNARQAHEQK